MKYRSYRHWNFRSLYSNWSNRFQFLKFREVFSIDLMHWHSLLKDFTSHSHYVKVLKKDQQVSYIQSQHLTNQWTQILYQFLMTYRINSGRSTKAEQELSMYWQRRCPVCKQQDPLCHRNCMSLTQTVTELIDESHGADSPMNNESGIADEIGGTSWCFQSCS